ncbi:hypothetical protein [Rhizobium sp. EC-SD404]|uniref:5-methylcytosine restriction system specificity protein McrC n=1 Tax=Rhizobium sp. EC-SD404 TaxID=2038389 RepID=UPI0018FEE97D|nr:hypothetical protein [Rhizobium sp. EC-SD404]
MKIPVRNLYYLLLYAWGHFQPGTATDVGADASPDLPNLFAKILIDRTRVLLRRGLDRGYRAESEETRSPRERLLIGDILKRQTLRRGAAVCEIDELTNDVLNNRILLSSLLRLASCSDVKPDLRHDLRIVASRMAGVSKLRLSANLFYRVQLSRNTSQYGLLMKICEFVFWALMPEQDGSSSRFQSILDDEMRMSAIFEEFLRGFYRTELRDCHVGSEMMSWSASAIDSNHLALLPAMQTDITIRSARETTIVDAKFYREVLGGGRYSARLRSAHLYQLATYLAHAQRREPARRIRGLLVYPQVHHALDLDYEILGFPVRVSTVDLSAPWRQIREELLSVQGEGKEDVQHFASEFTGPRRRGAPSGEGVVAPLEHSGRGKAASIKSNEERDGT